MKLVRYGPAGKEKPGLIDADGKLRDLSRKVKDIDGADAGAGRARQAAQARHAQKLPLVKGKPRLGACVATPLEVRRDRPELRRSRQGNGHRRSPSIPSSSSRPQTCIVGPNDNVMLPPGSTHTDWEVELGVVIGRTARTSRSRMRSNTSPATA